MKKHILLFLILTISLNCDDTKIDCSTVLCIGPPVLLFEVLNSGENVIENETYTLENITIEGTDADTFVLMKQSFETGLGIKTGVSIENENWIPKAYDITLKLGSDFALPVEIGIELSEAESCCGGIPIVKSVVINGEIQSLNNGNIFTIEL